MKQLFEHQLLVLANDSKDLTFYPLKKNKRCWHKKHVNLHLLTIKTSNLVIFTCKIFSSGGCFKFHNVDFDEYNLVSMPTTFVLRFCQGVSKN
jgi:hypothetical protein